MLFLFFASTYNVCTTRLCDAKQQNDKCGVTFENMYLRLDWHKDSCDLYFFLVLNHFQPNVHHITEK